MYNFNDLKDIIKKLRSPNGCPWDREQTIHSLLRYLIDECYEVIESSNKGGDEFADELGDLLLQIMILSEISSEKGQFNIDTVVDMICSKMIRRHPHVFDNLNVSGSEEVLKNWEEIKKKEKSMDLVTERLKEISYHFPALLRAEKVQKRASKAGFDWDNHIDAFNKLKEEVDELNRAIEDKTNIEEEFGDVLFAIVNVGRFIKTSPELALNNATDKFIKRFEKMELLANEKNMRIEEMTLKALDELWEEVKSCE